MKKKYQEKTKNINIDPLNRVIKLVCTNNISKSRNKRSKKLGVLKNKLTKYIDGLCCYHKDSIIIFIDTKASLGVISHEAYHAVLSMFRYIGVEEYDEEITAYHLGYIVDEIYKVKKKYKK